MPKRASHRKIIQGAFDIDETQVIPSQEVKFPLYRKTSNEAAIFSATVGVAGDVDRSQESPARLPITIGSR
jgi:hypothetical protein